MWLRGGGFGFWVGLLGGAAGALVGFFVLQALSRQGRPAGHDFSMPVDRSLAPGQSPFELTVSLDPEVPSAGQEVNISAVLQSRTSPHTRAVVTVLVDGRGIGQAAEVVPPLQQTTVVQRWTATSGTHDLRVTVSSAAGVEYAAWERRLTVEAEGRTGLSSEEPGVTPSPLPAPSTARPTRSPATPTASSGRAVLGTPSASREEGSPFALTAALRPETFVAGERVEIVADVLSETAPHTRVQVGFLIDGELAQALSVVVPPFDRSRAVQPWDARSGSHRLEVVLSSPAGERYASWAQEVAVPGGG